MYACQDWQDFYLSGSALYLRFASYRLGNKKGEGRSKAKNILTVHYLFWTQYSLFDCPINLHNRILSIQQVFYLSSMLFLILFASLNKSHQLRLCRIYNIRLSFLCCSEWPSIFVELSKNKGYLSIYRKLGRFQGGGQTFALMLFFAPREKPSIREFLYYVLLYERWLSNHRDEYF